MRPVFASILFVTTLSWPILGLSKTCFDELGLGPEYREDLFFQPMRMPGGPYQGECLDNRERRNAKLLSKKDAFLLLHYGITIKPNHTYFANFKHRNKYYIAEYPNDSIANTYLVFEKFLELGGRPMEEADVERAITNLVLTGHIQLRFKLKKGKHITLYPQHRSFGGVKRINDFAYAMFARPKLLEPSGASGTRCSFLRTWSAGES